MINNKIKFLTISLSYFFFIFLIIICVNAVVPEEDLITLDQKEKLIEKVENTFSRNKNSVYEILEKNEKILDKKKILNEIDSINEEDLKKKKKLENISNDFRLQFASFKLKEKSLDESKKLKKKLLNFSDSISFNIKKVKINKNQTFYRVVSNNQFSFNQAKDVCYKLKKLNIKCIVIKDQE